MAWDDDELIAKALDDSLKPVERPSPHDRYTSFEMELRDNFAAHILGGWCSDDTIEVWECDEEEGEESDGDDSNAEKMKRYAENAYRMADAMMAARKK